MSNVNAKPTYIQLGNLHIQRRNIAGWHREETGKLKLYLTFKSYGLHTEWINGTEEEIDEMYAKLLELKENNML